jgi:thiol-disulfide isomerase/thioredoxin
VSADIDWSRRHFLGTAALSMAAAEFGVWASAADAREARELAAIGRAQQWLNSARLTAPSLAGKVVLVHFWTYTCINWLRTLPYVRAWAQKYGRGLVVVGVHTPEFEFEKNVDNVRRAVRQMRIEYPVVIDNDYSIWRAFNNSSWPALHLVDARGQVRHSHMGEGEYVASERGIQRLLADAGSVSGDQRVVSLEADGVEAAADWDNLRSPETYVGFARMVNFSSPGGAKSDRRSLYAAPKRMMLNQWALVGEWRIGEQATVLSGRTGRIAYRFHARDLHLVMGPPRSGPSVRFRVSIDGQPPGSAHGGDIDAGGNGVVVDARLYQLVRAAGPVLDRQFEIEFFDSGVETFAFTFG